ncbi:MAG: HIT family protein [Patescibacteria group bacterium]|jgi:histidine triad (HIT) family protein
MDCIFCKIIAGEIPSAKVYEDDNFLAFLDIAPVNPGHTLIIPKTHRETLLDLPAADACRLLGLVQKIAPAVLSATGTKAFNLMLNNGPASGQVVGHAHFHIVPRFEGDGLKLWPGREDEPGRQQELAEKIKTQIS